MSKPTIQLSAEFLASIAGLSPEEQKVAMRRERNRIWSCEYMRRRREQNPELFRERMREWRKANPEKHREFVRKWKKENPGAVREARRKYAELNPERERERKRRAAARWRRNNPEKNREKVRIWCALNPAKAKALSRRSQATRERREQQFSQATNFVSTLNNVQKLAEATTMITETPTVTLRSSDNVDNFISLIAKAGEHLREAAEMLSRLVANDPATITKIREKAPAIPTGLLTNLLRVGERSLHPDLLLNNCLAYRKLKSLPYSTQERVLQLGAVELVVNVETGDALRVPLTELTSPQISQALSPEGIRSRDDQRAWLKRQQVGASAGKSDSPAWFVKKDRLIITRACEMSKSQLLAVMSELV